MQNIKEGILNDSKFRIEASKMIERYKKNWRTDYPLNDFLNDSSIVNIKGSNTNRYEGELAHLKKFSVYLFIKGGPSLYESLYLNSSLPSISTCSREILSGEKIQIGKLYLNEFLVYMKSLDVECYDVIVAEDATRLSGVVEYDSSNNQLVGLLPETDFETGLPKLNFFSASTPSITFKYLKACKVAPYLQLITAKPMFPGTHAKVLGLFPTDNSYSMPVVVKRWREINNFFVKNNIQLRIASDADPRMLGAMKQMSCFGKKFSIPGTNMNLYCDIHSDIKFISDPLHELNNLKNRMSDCTGNLKIGKFYVKMNFLKILVNKPNISRIDHFLSNSDIGSYDSTKDKMNVNATRKICDQKVIDLLESVSGSEGTVAYLKIMRAIHDAFITVEITDRERLYKGFWALHMVRTWRNNTQIGEREKFITNVNWCCLEINVSYLYELVLKGKVRDVILWNSQTCEEYFRTLRAMTPSGLTQINFSLKDSLHRLNRVEQIFKIVNEQKNIFNFPENNKMKSDQSTLPRIRNEPIGERECSAIINRAMIDSQAYCEFLGMNNFQPYDVSNNFQATMNDEQIEQYLIRAYGEQEENNQISDSIQIEDFFIGEKKIVKFKNLYFF